MTLRRLGRSQNLKFGRGLTLEMVVGQDPWLQATDLDYG